MKRRQFILSAIASAATIGGAPEVFGVRPRRRYSRNPQLVERWSWAMGQPVRLVLFHESEAEGYDAAEAALQEMWQVEARLSRHSDQSDLEELNRHAGRGLMRVGEDLLSVLRSAEVFRVHTAGAFNIAVEPLMRVWGFREPRMAPPGRRELTEAEAAVRAAVVRLDGNRVALPAAGTRLDLGGIGVGYALDRAAEVLRRRGVAAALLDVSGDLLAMGAPPGEEAWEVEIADSRQSGVRIATARIRDEAIATSANTRAVIRLGRRVVGHVMDPDRGAPADRIVQATVTAPTAIAADALSTAMLVTGRRPPGATRGWLLT